MAPAFLNLSMLVSAPKAVIAIVRRKVSKVLMASLTAGEKRLSELKPITTKNKTANQGMVIPLRLVCVSASPCLPCATNQLTTSNTGTKATANVRL